MSTTPRRGSLAWLVAEVERAVTESDPGDLAPLAALTHLPPVSAEYVDLATHLESVEAHHAA